MRLSNEQIENGVVVNGFDYSLQVWVKDGIIQQCGHPEFMKVCCNQRKFAGKSIIEITEKIS